MAENLTTYTEDLESMRARLVARGAGNTAVGGTVIDKGEQYDLAYRAAYHVDLTQEPPVISQLILSPTGKSSALTRTTVIEDKPHMSTTMVHQLPGFDVAVQLDLLLLDQQPDLMPVVETETYAPFTYAYDYAHGFEPDSSL